MLLENIEKYVYLIWIDSDAFFYNDGNNIVDLIESHNNTNFIFSNDIDNKNINSGFFIVKNTQYSIDFLKKWGYDEELCKTNPYPQWCDQGVLIDMFNKNLIFIENESPLLQYRTHRIALGRNRCLNIIKTEFPDYNYFIMMDCDNRCSYNIKIELLKNMLNRNDWDSVYFKHPSGYYDSWALSKSPYVLSCHHFSNPGLGVNLINNIINKTPKHQLIPCLSAFNGFAIYRTNKFINCTYDGKFRLDYIPKQLIKENIKYAGPLNLTQNKEDCEHRHFHFEAIKKNNARIRICPQLFFVN